MKTVLMEGEPKPIFDLTDMDYILGAWCIGSKLNNVMMVCYREKGSTDSYIIRMRERLYVDDKVWGSEDPKVSADLVCKHSDEDQVLADAQTIYKIFLEKAKVDGLDFNWEIVHKGSPDTFLNKLLSQEGIHHYKIDQAEAV